MQILQGYWQAVGINVDIQVVDTPVYNGLVFVRAKEPTEHTGWHHLALGVLRRGQ